MIHINENTNFQLPRMLSVILQWPVSKQVKMLEMLIRNSPKELVKEVYDTITDTV